jgi:hypothetical protein
MCVLTVLFTLEFLNSYTTQKHDLYVICYKKQMVYC